MTEATTQREFKDDFTANLYLMHTISDTKIFSGAIIADTKRRYRAQNAELVGVDRISRRAALAKHIAEHAQGGKVALVVDSMDCDCYRSVSGSLYPAGAAIIERELDRIYSDAEGPTSWEIVSPDEMPESYGRDLALEAFEDGHPHVVYM